ncbi:hypothetical protein [Klebsiella pneumoniae]|uniref:hypothetical protein n=1 Tax=Klebsiella pneumoniae TaxID=573 RepID=UPI003D16DAA6
MEAKSKKSTKLAMFVMVINIIALCYSFVLSTDTIDRFYRGRYIRDEDWIYIFMFLLSLINLWFSSLFRKTDGDGVISLIIKRRRLEELQRIRDLESKK